MSSRIQPIGYLTDGQGRVVYAVVPIEQLPKARRPRVKGEANPKVVANPIRVARLAAGLTQESVARAIGVSQPMLSLQEQEGRRLRPLTVSRALAAIERLRTQPGKAMDVEAILAAYAQVMEKGQSRKRRDPVERKLLERLGDASVLKETEGRVKKAGERAKPPGRRRKL